MLPVRPRSVVLEVEGGEQGVDLAADESIADGLCPACDGAALRTARRSAQLLLLDVTHRADEGLCGGAAEPSSTQDQSCADALAV